jgi:hypothetical protein
MDGRRSARIAGGLLSAAVCLGFYLSTLAPGALGGDAGELQVVPYTLSLAHPTGYPLLTLLGKAWVSLVGLGSIAWRMNLLSALAGALTVGLIYSSVLALTKSMAGALAAALSLGLSPIVWSQAVLADKYILNALLLAAVILTLVRYHQHPTQGSLVVSAAVYGLSLTHHRSMLVFGPLLVLFWLWREPMLLRQPRRILWVLAAMAGPLLLYAYLPFGAARAWDTALWKAPASAQGWLDYILDRNFLAEIRPDVSVPERLRNYAETLLAQFGWHGLALGLAGLVHQIAARRDRLGAFLMAGFVLQVILSTGYQVPRNWLFFIPSFVLFCVWIGEGAAAVWALAGRAGRAGPRVIVGLGLAGVLLVGSGQALAAALAGMRREQDPATVMDLYRINLKSGYQAERLIANGLARVAPNSLVLADWEQATPLWYAQYATGQRQDAAVVYPIELLTPALTARQPTYIARTYPTLGEPYRFSAEGALLRVTTQPGFQPPQTDVATRARFGNDLELIGYTRFMSNSAQGDVYAFGTTFRAVSESRPDLQLSVRLWDAQGVQVWQEDRAAFALGMYPTSRWVKDEVVGDYFEIPLPATLAPGAYRAGLIVYERRGDAFNNLAVVDGTGPVGIVAYLPEFTIP